MSWPLASDFSAVLQNPAFAFADSELKTVEIEKDANRQPKPRSGNFANVYKGILPNGKPPVAVRVFTSESPERRERYQAIADHLAHCRLDCLVNFTYRDDGIRSMNGKRYPLVTMEWVRGEQLFEWVQRKCDDRDKKSLIGATDSWVATMKELRAAKIAHGDLQHANVMVDERGKLKLVDYDCMCVPSLVGRKNLEIGVDPYQHPTRDQDTKLSLSIDNFSSIFIFIALKAVAESPELWLNYVERPGYDKLLFRREDLDSPKDSRLMQELQRSKDKEVQRLAKELVDLTHLSIDQVPPLDELLFSFSSVESLLSQRDFDGAIELLTRNRKQVVDAPAPLQPRIHDAQERIYRRLELEKAVASGDEPAMQRLYLPKLLDDYPRAQPCVAVAKLAPRVIPVLARLQTTSQSHKWREFVQEWDAHEVVLQKRKSAERFAVLAQTWKPRNQAWDQVLGLLGKPVNESGALSAAWSRLAQLGGHPESDGRRSQIIALLDREQAWIAFRKVPRTPSATADAELIQAWKETSFKGWDQAERERPRTVQARQRLDAIQQIRQLASRLLGAASEEAIGKIAGSIPADYKHELESRVQLAGQRVAALHQLQLAFKEPVSDLKLVEIVRRLDQLQAATLVSATEIQRISLAQKRVPLLELVKRIPPDYTIQHAPNWDTKLLAIWKHDLLNDSYDAQPWLKVYQQACQRKLALDKLQAAIAGGEKMLIAQTVSDPSLKGYPLPSNWYRIAKQARAEVKNIRAMLNALTHKDASALWLLFDARVVRQNPAIFAPYQEQLLAWMRLATLPADKMGLGFPVARGGVTSDSDQRNAFRLCWNWPDPRFCDECLVAICPNKPRAGEDPRASKSHVRMPIDRRSYEDGGGSRLIHIEDGWLGSYVIVWAVVNLGFRTCYSEPLILGQLEDAAKRSRHSPGSLFG